MHAHARRAAATWHVLGQPLGASDQGRVFASALLLRRDALAPLGLKPLELLPLALRCCRLSLLELLDDALALLGNLGLSALLLPDLHRNALALFLGSVQLLQTHSLPLLTLSLFLHPLLHHPQLLLEAGHALLLALLLGAQLLHHASLRLHRHPLPKHGCQHRASRVPAPLSLARARAAPAVKRIVAP